MATITEDYVSFETAKLLVRKGFGFNAEYESYYTLGGVVIYFKDKTQDINIAPRITLQMARKWLRKVHNLHIWVEPNHDKEGLYNAHVKVGWWSNNWGGVGYNTYEKATEEAIKYCLKHLIK